MSEKVNFGSTKVLKTKKIKLVSDIFSSVSNKYDLMNDAMSLGLHRLWKERMYDISKLKNTDNVLDLATGTGDIALKYLSKKASINITCLDENQEMLDICKNRLIDNGFVKNITFIKSPAETAKLIKNNYSLATVAFGFRNFTDHSKALKNIYDSILPGGRLIIMEFTTPKNLLIKNIFEKYTHFMIPRMGKILADDYDSYRYLAESIATYYSPEEVTEMFSETGFINTRYETLVGNMVTIHIGFKC
ncbi:MAG: ubiquinone/menaquinone biosynthesis methyltransferase [Gammaproteobacteria bacterium]|jgi:demethylmenaquinone methyltransferase / 2-methoxy-6-polyprenyl-1,4-benzoquinol methylase|nr:ubiquinone/menaquinone biosynthesis methyltransferase [Gammaproteobacteria bacterium]MBT4462191.1 ubiquinone/menaquinone biosynthesis methyltransferase [Gammaproteobacteria bacterium]MBT4654437.1 ubiquinone/menaquinone biosynthesis methyltransferase [Gammaproteobacteria bacterium]MBT5116849.1 ubiquinone/menaquinone biosynthesis methyltransferase [Gammaproteobacteria bacterium]MBT5761935.1 ubiquinone/menaquinone biosynthesis methyltransferase [Gammaproteobacteria bacterium]